MTAGPPPAAGHKYTDSASSAFHESREEFGGLLTKTQSASSSSHAWGTEHDDEKSHRHRKHLRGLPFRCELLADPRGPWLREEDEVTKWLPLYFDLIIVAVLTAFNMVNEMGEAKKIPIFVSYFIIIQWLWSTQTQYDVRFEAEDWFHRIAKGLQFLVFTYIGAMGAGWDLGHLRQIPEDAESQERIEHAWAAESFLTVAITFAVYRVILAIQYAFVIFAARRVGRTCRREVYTVVALLISAVIAASAAGVPANSGTTQVVKVTLLYLSIGIELCLGAVQMYHSTSSHRIMEKITERYGSFTIVLLGEGFISTIKALARAIRGLSEKSKVTYGQVFLAIGILYMVWGFLYHNFHEEDTIRKQRAALWEFMHFPLHLCLILFIAALVNVVTYASWNSAYTHAINTWGDVLENIGKLTPAQIDTYGDFLDRVDPTTSFRNQYDWIVSNMTAAGKGEPAQDPSILALLYTATTMYSISKMYQVPMEESVTMKLAALERVNTTWTEMDSPAFEAMKEHTFEFLTEVYEGGMAGIWWLFPTAGGLLLMCTLRSMIRYRFHGKVHHIVHGVQIGLSVALAALGLLALGPHHYAPGELEGTTTGSRPISPMVSVAYRGFALATVFLVYLTVTLCTLGLGSWELSRRKKNSAGLHDWSDRQEWHGGEAGEVMEMHGREGGHEREV